MSLVDLSTSALNVLRDGFKMKGCMEKLEKVFNEIQNKLEQDGSYPAAEETALVVLDLSLRRLVDELAWKMHKENLSLVDVGIPQLLDVCIAAAVKGLMLNNAPYRVLEDLLQGQTIKVSEQLWDLLEERRDQLTTKTFIVPGKNTKASLSLLKLSNFLLRKLSKTHDSIFCGKVLAFLAYTFSLSERSALNLGRKSNIGNITEFEDEETFKAAEEIESQTLDEKRAALEECIDMEIDENESSSQKSIDYNFYKIFWDVQRFCRSSGRAIENVKEWGALERELDTVLSAFEGNAFSPDDLERAKEIKKALEINVSQSEEQGDGRDHFFQPKYLTNSRLLRLQLRDPVLRQCMLTQFMTLIDCWKRLKMPQALGARVKTQLPLLEERVCKLLESTPDGESFMETISHVLERERNWTLWKNDKCPPYERGPVEKIEVEKETEISKTREKRSLNGTGKDDATNTIKKMMNRIITEPPTGNFLEGLDAPSRDNDISLKSLTEKFTEAWDPENGIDEDYWPQHDLMICWRTMRTTWKTKVMLMKHATKGVPELVHQITGVKPPPTKKSKTETKESKPEEPDVQGSNESKDVEMEETASKEEKETLDKSQSKIDSKSKTHEKPASEPKVKAVRLTKSLNRKVTEELEEGEA